MGRPSRFELLRKFFPELGDTDTGGETEAAIAINTRACEVVLSDLITHFDQSFQSQGPGALCLNLALRKRGAYYTPLEDFCADLLIAERLGEHGHGGALRDIISTVRLNNYDERVLVLLIDRSKASLLPIPRVEPARGIQDAQEAATL